MDKKEYALETMNEGVLIIAKNGQISYANTKAKEIFPISDAHSVLFQTVLSDPSGRNDELIDLVIDVISTGEVRSSRLIHYFNGVCSYSLFSSCTKMDDNQFVFTFTDQTQLAAEVRKRNDATVILSLFFIIACMWTIGVSVWMRTGELFDVGHLTTVMEVIGAAAVLLVLQKTSLKFKDMGIPFDNIVPTLQRTAVRLLVLLGLFCVVKLLLHLFYPGFFHEDFPFWDWKQADSRLIKYLFTAFIQEFLARGGVQSSLSRILSGKHAKDHAIFLTSIYFMSLHFQYGLPMMIGSGVLSVILGYIYKKDGNIYGATLVHYCFGKFADFLHLL